MSRYQIKLPGGEVAISSKDARYLEERDGEVWALMIAGHCFSWWSNDQLRRRAARKEKARIEQKERVGPSHPFRAVQSAIQHGRFLAGVLSHPPFPTGALPRWL